MRYRIGFSKTSGAAAGLLCDFRAGSTSDARMWELKVFAETAVSGTVGLVRATNAGTTPSGGLTPVAEDSKGVALATTDLQVYPTYATEPTQATVYMDRIVLPATVGAGMVWTFPAGLVIPVGGGLLLRQLSVLAVTYSISAVLEV